MVESLAINKVSDLATYAFKDRELTLFNTSDFEKKFIGFFEKNKDDFATCSFDLDNVEYIDSTAMSFLVRSHLVLKKNGKRLVLKNVNKNVMDILRTTRLDRDFHIE